MHTAEDGRQNARVRLDAEDGNPTLKTVTQTASIQQSPREQNPHSTQQEEAKVDPTITQKVGISCNHPERREDDRDDGDDAKNTMKRQ